MWASQARKRTGARRAGASTAQGAVGDVQRRATETETQALRPAVTATRFEDLVPAGDATTPAATGALAVVDAVVDAVMDAVIDAARRGCEEVGGPAVLPQPVAVTSRQESAARSAFTRPR